MDDDDENSLIKAHRYARQAEEAQLKGHWQQAIDKHTRAAHHYSQCIGLTSDFECNKALNLLIEENKQACERIRTFLNIPLPKKTDTLLPPPLPSSLPPPPPPSLPALALPSFSSLQTIPEAVSQPPINPPPSIPSPPSTSPSTSSSPDQATVLESSPQPNQTQPSHSPDEPIIKSSMDHLKQCVDTLNSAAVNARANAPPVGDEQQQAIVNQIRSKWMWEEELLTRAFNTLTLTLNNPTPNAPSITIADVHRLRQSLQTMCQQNIQLSLREYSIQRENQQLKQLAQSIATMSNDVHKALDAVTKEQQEKDQKEDTDTIGTEPSPATDTAKDEIAIAQMRVQTKPQVIGAGDSAKPIGEARGDPCPKCAMEKIKLNKAVTKVYHLSNQLRAEKLNSQKQLKTIQQLEERWRNLKDHMKSKKSNTSPSPPPTPPPPSPSLFPPSQP